MVVVPFVDVLTAALSAKLKEQLPVDGGVAGVSIAVQPGN
jgi:hypothetical protein